ncbi:hypothetical protein [Polaromonas sp.]|uniref:hypothetical protein n=1 Tax=Polaromonas sp. TaxID=1869339 RepID=UPI00286C9E53|nr:hypothetical protein [Polaromonas sp.]
MKQITTAFFLTTLSLLAGAQSVAPAAQTATMEAERNRISADRARLEAGFLAEDAACYKRFFVNNCLAEVNVRRRETMADLRRQEISLNDEERKIKGAEQIRKIEEKSLPERQQEAAASRSQALQDSQTRLDREKKAQEDRAAAQSREKANSQASADRLKSHQAKTQARQAAQVGDAEEARKFNARQKEAQQRRAQHESERLKRMKPPAKSLPLPE